TVPDVHAGTRTVTAKDRSGYSASARFAVGGAISLNLNAGPVGSTVTLSGNNFKPGNTMHVRFDGEEVHTSGSCTTDASGKLSNCGFTVPVKPARLRPLTVSDSAKNSATGTYTITPDFSVTPSEGPVGSSATINGTGFTAFAPITVTVGDHHVTTPN